VSINDNPIHLTKHVIVGAGAVGTATALRLADQGHEVMVVTRSGTGPSHPGIRLRKVDAIDSRSLTEIATGAAAIFNCANPPYNRWVSDWPPLAASILSAAESTGAVLVTMSNLYGYGSLTGTMAEDHALAATSRKGRVRAHMWAEALAAHESGRVRATEARASDFIGAGLGESAHMGSRVIDRVVNGKSVSVIGSADQPHSWTAINDVAATLATLASDERAWGRAWHVPSAQPATQREMVQMIGKAAGRESVKVTAIPRLALRLAGLASPTTRELLEISYQFERPFVIDSTSTTATFGIHATSLAVTVQEAISGAAADSIA